MTIAIIGGEGSVGKTRVLNLVAQHLALTGKPTLYGDANPDQNGLEAGGVPERAISELAGLTNGMDFLRHTLEGDNPRYNENLDHVISTTTVTEHTKLWSVDPEDPVMQEFSLEHNGLFFMQTGSFTAEDAGIACSHDKIGPLVFMLQRLDDGETGQDANVLIDYAHGEDGFGTPLYPQSDIIVVVARPNKKSRDIMGKYLDIAEKLGNDIGHKIEVAVIGNQLSTDPDRRAKEEAYLKEAAGDNWVGGLSMDPAMETGFDATSVELSEILPENQNAIAALADRIEAAERIPERKHEWLKRVHVHIAPWFDEMYNTGGTILDQANLDSHVCGSDCDHHGHDHKHHKPK